MRVAVVAPSYGDPWREEDLIIRRVAAALASRASVEVLVTDGKVPSVENDGALVVRHFPSDRVGEQRRRALTRTTLRETARVDLSFCTCFVEARDRVEADLPKMIREELARSEGGDSRELIEYLAAPDWDAVVFAGYKANSTRNGINRVSDGTRVILLPMAREEATLYLDLYDHVFARAQQLLVISESEERLMSHRLGQEGGERIVNIRFALNVNQLAIDSDPPDLGTKRFVVVARDWTQPCEVDRILGYAARLARDFSDVRLVLVGRACERLPKYGWLGVRETPARTDVWRWMSRSLALLDAEPHRLLGREVLEAMLFGTPVVVHERGGASREHAELGSGGHWFGNYDDVYRSVETLLSDSAREDLGRSGREYASREYLDAERFIDRVTRAVFA